MNFAYKIWLETFGVKENLTDIGIDGIVTLKWSLDK